MVLEWLENYDISCFIAKILMFRWCSNIYCMFSLITVGGHSCKSDCILI